MALVEKRTPKVTIGPSMPLSEGGDPPNPAETLRTGPVPRRVFNETTQRYSLEPNVNLFRGESKRVNKDWNNPDDSSQEDYCEPKPQGLDPAGAKFGKQPPPSPTGNKETTENGVRIYGT